MMKALGKTRPAAAHTDKYRLNNNFRFALCRRQKTLTMIASCCNIVLLQLVERGYGFAVVSPRLLMPVGGMSRSLRLERRCGPVDVLPALPVEIFCQCDRPSGFKK
jgi:hypothetical protein